MLLTVPPGWMLTTNGRIVRGGPISEALPAGMYRDTVGQLHDDTPKLDPMPWLVPNEWIHPSKTETVVRYEVRDCCAR